MQVLVQRGQVWYAQVPFNNEVDEGKVRPVVVVGWSPFNTNDDHNILIVPSYTFGGDPSRARGGDMQLSDPASAGLGADSFIRTRRLMTLHPMAILWNRSSLGTLVHKDWEMVLTEIERLFSTPQIARVPGAHI
jgi:mRNA-degrading endonuclease toxin of MazEF toxin-antitoxin module